MSLWDTVLHSLSQGGAKRVPCRGAELGGKKCNFKASLRRIGPRFGKKPLNELVDMACSILEMPSLSRGALCARQSKGVKSALAGNLYWP